MRLVTRVWRREFFYLQQGSAARFADMIAQLLSPGYAVFAAAFVLMVGIGIVEALGLGIGHLDLDADVGEVGGGTLLDWLGLGRGLPVLVWLTSFLACFTFIGLALQQGAELLFGGPLHWSIASGAALVAGLAANAFFSGIIAGLFPEFESTAIGSEELLRRRATVLEGTARRGAPARAKVIDYHGQAHYVMVEPHDDAGIVASGETGLLVRKDGPLFFMLSESGPPFTSV